MAKYTIILEPNYPEEGYTVRVPALPRCITYGKNRGEALSVAKSLRRSKLKDKNEIASPSARNDT